MTKTTKSHRQAIRDKIASQPDEMVLFSEETVESLLDDLEAVEAELERLRAYVELTPCKCSKWVTICCPRCRALGKERQ